MDVSFYTILALKLTLVPALIIAASFVGTRWGPAASGWLISLPLTSGPVLFFLAIEQGTEFASTAAEGVSLGLASIAAFALAYVWLAGRRQRVSWFYPLLLGWGVYFLATILLDDISIPDVAATAGVIIFWAVTIKVLPTPPVVAPSRQRVGGREIMSRVVAATALVLFITGASTVLGPYLSGLLTPFPVYVSVLASSTYRAHGPTPAVQLVRGTAIGLFTPAVFSLIIGTTIVGLGTGVSFGLAVITSLPIHGLIYKFLS